MKLFVAMLATETNTFSPIPTGPNVWKETLLARRSDPRDQDPPMVLGARALLGAATEKRGWELAEGLFAFAQPAGPTPQAFYEELRDELVADLRASMPVDAVMLILHGAIGEQLARVFAWPIVGQHPKRSTASSPRKLSIA